MKKITIFFLVVMLAGVNSCAAQQPQTGSATPQTVQTSQPTPVAQQQAAPQVAQASPAPRPATAPSPQQTAPASAAPASQSKPKVAVYVTGGKTASENKALAARITHGLVNSGRYSAIERADAFLDQVAKEMVTQRSGAIDDKQISELGRQAGANFVCVGEILEVFGDHQVSARIINVVTVEIVASGVAEGPLKNINDFSALSNSVVALMLGVAPSAVTASSGAATSGGGQAAQALTQPAASQTASVTVSPQTAPSSSGNTFTDPRDGQTYRVVKIGNKKWMAQNLNFRVSANDSRCYGDEASNCEKYGRLYNWNAAMKACPAGWRLPTDNDWNDLLETIDAPSIAGRKLKSKTGWNYNGNGTDDYGFSALPGGNHRLISKPFANVGEYGYWWSTTRSGGNGAYYWYVLNKPEIYVRVATFECGFSVRCVQE